MATVDIDDTTFHYERSGSGPPMVFVHGMCGDADVWTEQARRFSGRFTCVRYDRRGHTRSARGSGPLTPSRHADDAAGLIVALDLAPCVLVGSSSGAVITLDVARRHGRLLDRVVLSEPPLLSLAPQEGDAFLAGLRSVLNPAMGSGGPVAAVDAFFSYVCSTFWAKAADEAKQRYRANAVVGLEDLRSPPLEVAPADLAAMTVPALVVTGTTSHPAFRAVARRLAEAWPGSRLVELEGCGHVTYAEQPERFGDAVATFAAGLGRSRGLTASSRSGARVR